MRIAWRGGGAHGNEQEIAWSAGEELLTVGQGDNLARTFGLCHPPHILYRVWLALAGLSTEMVGKVSSLPSVSAIGGDPLRTETPIADNGEEDALEVSEEGLY